MKKIIFVHLFNDRSGSPKVLSQVIHAARKDGIDMELLTSHSADGFLSDLPIVHKDIFYCRSENKIITLIYYLLSQFFLFFKCLRYIRQDAVFYINTLMPFGAALAGWLMRKPVIYHIHETSIRPQLLKLFLKSIVRVTSSKIIYVSDFLKKEDGFDNKKQFVVHNAINSNFIKNDNFNSRPFNVLMVCSLKRYKGVYEFFALAEKFIDHEDVIFNLVLNASQDEIDEGLKNVDIPSNISVFSRQVELGKFYNQAHVLLNLSRPDEWIETFGLTILEGMAYGLPVIVPPVGGPSEIVEDGRQGYTISCYETERITKALKELKNNPELYKHMSEEALARATSFDIFSFEKKIIDIIKL